MEYLRIGVIINTFGLKGELKIKSFSDFDDERYQKGNEVLVKINEEYKPFIVDTYRIIKGTSVVSFKDHNDINLVEHLKKKENYAKISKSRCFKSKEK